jgi:hypothetical protein
LDGVDVVSISNFSGYLVEGVGLWVGLIDADSVNSDAKFWFPYYQSFERYHPVDLSESGNLFCCLTIESNVVAFEDSKAANLGWSFNWADGLINELLQGFSDLLVTSAAKLVLSGLQGSFGSEGDFNFCSFETAFGLLFLVFFVSFLVVVAERASLGLSLDPGCCCYSSPVGWCGRGALAV